MNIHFDYFPGHRSKPRLWRGVRRQRCVKDHRCEPWLRWLWLFSCIRDRPSYMLFNWFCLNNKLYISWSFLTYIVLQLSTKFNIFAVVAVSHPYQILHVAGSCCLCFYATINKLAWYRTEQQWQRLNIMKIMKISNVIFIFSLKVCDGGRLCWLA